MTMSKVYFFRLILIISSILSFASANDIELEHIFKTKNVNGTLVISSLDDRINYTHNRKRAIKRYLPASTFKLPNTLIALDKKAIKDEHEIIKWDGKKRSFEAWNKNQNLKSALPVSCIWFYQELAKRIGNKAYLKHLKSLKYGNQKTGPKLTTFWLDGDIRISAIEQIEFLKKVHNYKLPYKKEHVDILKKIMVVNTNSNYTIRAKTGLVEKHGWYVGYVEKKNKIWFFALNIDINKKNDIKFRKEIVMESLKSKGII